MVATVVVVAEVASEVVVVEVRFLHVVLQQSERILVLFIVYSLLPVLVFSSLIVM